MAPFYPDLGCGAVCEFCGTSATHRADPDVAMEAFAAKGWDFLPTTLVDASTSYLASCPNAACRAELGKLEKAAQR